VALGVMMVALDASIVAVANPAIQAQLHASLAGIQWVTSAYLLALAVTLITIGKFGDRFGHRRIFLIGVVGFGLSSAAIGLSGAIAGNIGLVIGFRVLQGVFGAMMQPPALALVRAAFPAEKLKGALSIWSAILSASTAAGPIVGGLLVQHVNWEACFYVNVPVGLIALVMGLSVLRETRPARAARSFDAAGTGLLSAALFLLVWGLIKAPGYGWGSGTIIAFFAGAAAAGVLFVLRERRAPEPVLPLRLFRSVALSAGTVLVLLLMFGLFGGLFFMTFYFENVHGYSPVKTGLWLLPLTGVLIIGSSVAGMLIKKLGPRIVLAGGMILAAAGLFGLSRLGAASSPGGTVAWFILLGLGFSPVIVGATDVIIGHSPVELTGVAGGLQATAMQVGAALGTSVLASVMAARVASLLPARWNAAHLPPLTPAQLGPAKNLVSVGEAPVKPGIPDQTAVLMTRVSRDVFTSGMSTALLIAAIAALAGAFVALLTRSAAHAGTLPRARAEADIRDGIEHWNENPLPLAWAKTAEEILNSLAEYVSKISGGSH
jgi:EmrB/QacA subfamily drug resistance transporter